MMVNIVLSPFVTILSLLYLYLGLYLVSKEKKEDEMPELFPAEFELAKKEWEASKKRFDAAVKLYRETFSILKEAQQELNDSWDKFSKQEIKLEQQNVINIRKDEE
jgi:hypothetical protein